MKEEYPGSLSCEIVKTVIKLRGGTKQQVMERLVDAEFYPTDDTLRQLLCRLAKRNLLIRDEVRGVCESCGTKKYIWKATDTGRVYAAGGA